MTEDEHEELRTALIEGEFKFNRQTKCWVGHGRSINCELLEHLDLWQLDQVIAAVRAGQKTVSLGEDSEIELA